MVLVGGPNFIGVNENNQNNLTFRICQGAASSSFGPFGSCNMSRLSRDVSGGPWTPLRLYN
jgi:hypothetical protein